MYYILYMEKLIDTIKKNRDIRDSTLSVYLTNLNRLSKAITNEDYKDNKFLKKYDEIITYLKDKSNSVKRKNLSSILIALSPEKKNSPSEDNDELYKKYKSLLNNENNNYLDKIRNNNKSSKDLKNWVEWEEIINIRNKLLKQVRAREIKFNISGVKKLNDFFLVQDYLIASLYTLLPPRRLEYADVEIINKKDFDKLSQSEKDNNNYLVNVNKSKKFFHYGKNAVKSDTYDNTIVEIPRELNSLLNFWINTNKSKFLLVNNKGNKLTKNALSKKITEIFKETGKKISVVMLRKIFLSNKFGEVNEERKEIAKMMNHDVNTASTFYIKKD
jgi:hypothetical protein